MTAASKFSGLEIEIDTPSRMTIMHPKTGEPIVDLKGVQAYIDVYSFESDVATRKRRANELARANAPDRPAPNEDERNADDADFLAAISAGWYLVARNGEPIDLPFSIENARELYANRKTRFIARQVLEHARLLGNFVGVSSIA